MILAIAVAAAALPVGLASAQTAYATSFITSITYQNVGSANAQVTFTFYPGGNAAPIPIQRSLPANASDSLYVGAVAEISAGFSGSVVISSDQPIVATAVQVPTGTVKVRPLSNGFSQGESTVLIATVLKNQFNQTTRFSVQNAGQTPANWTVRFFAKGSSTETTSQPASNVPAGAAVSYDAGTVPNLPANFDGSAIIDTGGSGQIVATALELSTTGAGASSFEGVSTGGTTIYMPSALCNAFGGQNTFYAITNSTAQAAEVTVNYRDLAGNPKGSPQVQTAPANSKTSFRTCDGGVGDGFNGSAVITSNGPEIVAIGKVSGLGLSTAFVGSNTGTNKLALPYVRWATEANYNAGNAERGQRTFITIQNAGSSALAAGDVTVRYVGKDGQPVGVAHPLGAMAPGQKLNSNATFAGVAEFGYAAGQFGGGAIVEGPAGSQLVVVARVSQNLATDTSVTVGEDYNGIPVQ
jgi:hypothetical protein